MIKLTLILLSVVTLAAQPTFPTITKVYRPLQKTAGSKEGALVAYAKTDVATAKKPYLGLTLSWTHDPALRQFITFYAFGRTNLMSTNEALWGTTTNWSFEYRTSPKFPMLFLPNVQAGDEALPRLSDGRVKPQIP
jgi:hypothetical protein